ncbi:MAG TPA: hypothetical protein VFN25_06545 [Dokdonella sp.]|uniref:hypothetical protein n=1 Tax=Dokdonella sp. TaxID=2291710 RepID=UPI002D7F726B|nr:hypothetical protein [Dokdonella sp.]HET9032548.1 hypothetical protein [Dokdonella sp.]
MSNSLPHPRSHARQLASAGSAGLAMLIALVLGSSPLSAHEAKPHTKGIHSKPAKAVAAPFDIVHTKITTEGNSAIFHVAVSGKAGSSKPTPIGKLAGSTVFSYVWPTSIDPYVVGFESKSGILAFAVTAHPDFDDTPLFDESQDGDLGNDGGIWHSHWVVLQPDEACGKDALKVVDIPEGSKPRLPKTWPGLPILIDSPGWSPQFKGDTIEVRVPFDDIGAVKSASFDGVTAALRVNASVHNPLLCVADVFKVASGDLSLPGKVDQ